PDLAEQALEGVVRASEFRKTEAMHCRVAVADVWNDREDRIDQILHGEVFDVLDRSGGRAWGRARRDGVVGWVVLDSLAQGAPLATHQVRAVDAVLPLNALVIGSNTGLSAEDLRPIGEFEVDPVAVAERLIGRPHALGARSSMETDCSGLVQQALLACGLAGPRRSDAQAELGRPVSMSEARRGDIVVWLAPIGDHDWRGHSALMVDEARVIHSTGARPGLKSGVVVEPLDAVEARMTSEGFATAVFRRL
ncbi:hypothetical protein LTR94_025460, partial [Friedmanniomyces endolithicus]